MLQAQFITQPINNPMPPLKNGRIQIINRILLRLRRLMPYLVLIATLVLAISLFLFFFVRSNFHEADVKLELSAPDEVIAAQEVELKLILENNNPIALERARLLIHYPEGTLYRTSDTSESESAQFLSEAREEIELGTINEQSTHTFSRRLIFRGEKGTIGRIRAELHYVPQNARSSSFIKSTEHALIIQQSPVLFQITVPPNLFPNQRISVFVDYRNQSNEALKDMRLILRYPDGFVPEHYGVQPSLGANQWDLGVLNPQEGGRISVDGILRGSEGEFKKFQAELQQRLDEEYQTFFIAGADTVLFSQLLQLKIELKEGIKPNVSAGDKLTYQLEFSNQSRSTFGGLSLRAKLEGDTFDFSSIQSAGFFDDRSRSIIWSGAVIPQLLNLQPLEKGRAEFTVRLREDIPLDQTAIRVSGEIETRTVPPQFSVSRIHAQDNLVLQIATQTSFSAVAFYQDPQFPINSGPIPPKVGEKTTFIIHWRIQTAFNEIKNIRVSSFLPPGVGWEKIVKITPGHTLNYDPTTGRVQWTAQTIPEGSGLTLPLAEVVFQISITPSSNQVGDRVSLLQKSEFSAIDALNNAELNQTARDIDTNNVVDISGNGRVVL